MSTQAALAQEIHRKEGAAGLGTEPEDPHGFIEQVFSRNKDIVSDDEQATLQAMRVLIAGCGSVGGAVVESLTRLGVSELVLADPEAYDASNLNRQACYFADIGSNKATVLAQRVAAINPLARAYALPEGITASNVADALSEVSVVFDGIDVEVAPWEKYLLHEAAAERRVPVILGADFGGKPTLYVFDYRRWPTPFYGQTTADHHREGNLRQVTAWLGYRHFPSDFLPIVKDRFETGDPWPQVSYCVAGMAALGARVVLDVAMGREVPHVVSVDVHAASRGPLARLKEWLLFGIRGVQTLSAIRRQGGVRANPRLLPAPAGLPARLQPIVEAVRFAPSPHNIQPWTLEVRDEGRVRIGWDRSRWLSVADPEGEGVALAMGCALEAACTLAHLDFEPSPHQRVLDEGWFAGDLEVARLRRRDCQRRLGLLRHRRTNRAPYLPDPISLELCAAIERAVAPLGISATFVTGPRTLDKVGRAVVQAARAELERSEYVEELWNWMRFSKSESTESADGLTTASMGVNRVNSCAMELLRSTPALRGALLKVGLAAIMAREAGRGIHHCGGLVFLSTSRTDAQGLIAGGRAMMRVWLEATRHGYAVQPNHYALCNPAIRSAIIDHCRLPHGEHTFTMLRMGRSVTSPPPAPRREAAGFTVVGSQGRLR